MFNNYNCKQIERVIIPLTKNGVLIFNNEIGIDCTKTNINTILEFGNMLTRIKG